MNRICQNLCWHNPLVPTSSSTCTVRLALLHYCIHTCFAEKGSKAYKGEKTPGEGAGNTSAESLPKGGKSTKGGKLTKKGKGKTKQVVPGDENIVLLAKVCAPTLGMDL